jgi:glycine C-acetyltransferase
LVEEYDRLVRESLNWELKNLETASKPFCKVDGREVLMLCANNYLNLSTHPKVVEAMVKATQKYGAGAGSDRSISGNMSLHEELDLRLAEFKGAPAALTFQTGYMVNEGVIPQLCGRGDLYISDQLNHGSIIDGVRLSHADRAVYKHKDVEDLARVLENAEKHDPPYKHIWIITDGVFSMDGDLAPLPEIAKLAKEHGAGVYVDDAHGEGVLGTNGKGIVDHFALDREEIHLEMGTFSKAFGVVGGHISCGRKEVRSFIFNMSRTFLLSASVPPGVAAACIAAIDILEDEPDRVKQVWRNRDYFLKAMKDLGFDTGNSETPIVPVMCGKSETGKELAKLLWEEGIFVLPIFYPMVAKNATRIRVQLCSEHTQEQLDRAIETFEKCGKKLNII